MSNPQRLRFRIGLFVLRALILLAGLITLFGGFPDLFRKYDKLTVRFTDAPGVQPGTPVRLSGIRIGQVKRVELDKNTGDVIVHIIVDREYPLYGDDQATLVSGVLGGETSIDFVRRGRQPPKEELIPRPSVLPEPPPPDPVPGADRPAPDPPQLAPAAAGEEESQAKQEERQPVKP